MQKNVGSIDRAIRALAGIALLAVYFLGAVEGTLGVKPFNRTGSGLLK
jgi:hypothetical protein